MRLSDDLLKCMQCILTVFTFIFVYPLSKLHKTHHFTHLYDKRTGLVLQI